MNLLKSKIKLISGFAGAALAIGLALTPVIASAATAADLQAQINALLSQIQSLQGQLAATGGSSSTMASTGYTFNMNLKVGSTGSDVMNLQKVLNSLGYSVATTGAGSPGHESTYFGNATKAAVMKFQQAKGISPVSGYVGPLTRAALNGMNTSTTGTTGSTTGTTGSTTGTVGGTLVVGNSTQPANSLAPQGAARVPFTTFTLTNTGSTAVTVTGVTVQRTGLMQDAVLSGIVLVDSNNVQIGTSKTLNSNHQATIGDTFTINPGQTMTLTVAGNMASSLANYAGEVGGIEVVGLNTSASVSGSFPIMGASQTINATLTIGSVSTSTSSFDPGSSQTRNIGDTGVRFSGIKFTANSAEDLKFYSVRWRQVGTAGPADIGNIATVINGVSYPATVDSTGKYYTSVFPGGILIPKGNSIDMYVQGDIVGTNVNSRTVEFDIDKVTDVYFVGQLYGYGIAPSGTYTPWFAGHSTTLNAGTATTIQKANSVAAQNVASNIPNTILGGFTTNFSGEPVTTNSMVFNFGTTTAGLGGLITSVSLVDQNGNVVAGPVDATWTSSSKQTVTFTDTVTFPIGSETYTLKGKIPSTATNGAVITTDTTPSGWGSVTGQTSGNSITISTGNFTMNPVTVKAASLTVNLSTQPASQNIVAGAQNLVLANLQLDASQSGEDIRLSSLPVVITVAGGGAAADLTGCQLYNGTTALNTGSRVVNTFTSGTAKTYSFDNSLTIPKGTIVSLALECNVASGASANATYQVTADTTNGDYSVTGVTSGNSVTTSSGLTLGSANGGTMTVKSGSLTMSVDPSSPSYTVVAGGSTGVKVGVIKFRASNEAVSLTKLGVQLTYGSSTDVTAVHLYQNGSPIGDAYFTGSNTSATSTLTNALTLTKDTDTLVEIRADFANIGTGQSGTEGKFIQIDPMNAQGNGLASGALVYASSTAGTNDAGVRSFKSYPTIAQDTVSSTGIGDGILMKFKVTANAAGPVGIQQMNFKLSTTTLSVTNVQLFAYTDSAYSNAISSQGTSGQIGSTVANPLNATAFSITPTTNPVEVPAGSTLYFKLIGSISGNATGASVVTTMLGDSAYPVTANPIDQAHGYFVATSSALTSGNNFVWSGNATSTSATADVDWSNGYGLPGFPSSGLIQSRSY